MVHVVALAAVVAATLVAYAGAPPATFVFDAQVLVGENPILRDASGASVVYLLTHDYWQPMATDGLYRPLTMLSFLFDYAVLGHADNAAPYVVENVLLHCVCAALVYALVWRLSARRWAATVSALLFALHPITTEAVTNVVGRADLLATAGVLGGVACWAAGRSASGWRRVALGLGLAVTAVVALFSKESGLVLVPSVLLYDLAYPPEAGRRLRAEHVVVAVVLVGYLAARWYVDRIGLPPEDIAPVDNPIAEAPFLAGRLTAIGVLVRELGLLVWPATLSVDYSYRQIPIVAWPPASAGDWMALIGVPAIAAAGWGIGRLRRSEPALFFLTAFAALALLPSSNLVRVIGSIMAERFLYLPLAGVAGAVAIVADRWATSPSRRRLASVAVGVVALACGARTAVRNRDWRDDRSLWAATVRAAPESAKAQKGYAGALYEPTANPQVLAQLVTYAERAVELRPDYLHALVDLGGYYIRVGDAVAPQNPGAARLWYEKAAAVLERARPLDERTQARFVEKMRARGHADDTIPEIGNGVLYNNLSLVYVKLEQLDDALAAYESMRRLAPTTPAIYRDIATLQNALGRTEDAVVTLWEAVALDENDGDTKQRLVDLYRAMPDGGAIVTTGPSGEVQLHTAQPIVARHRCRAWHELTAIFTRARLPALAERTRAEAASCSGG
jgi:tetratricopeptide (TPR) repeat protein